MLKIAIPYSTRSGHTEKLARLISEGIDNLSGMKVSIINVNKITKQDWETLQRAHGIIFGSPTYLGSIAADYKMFLEKTSSSFWLNQMWGNKIAAGFTIGTSPSGDKLNTLTSMAIFAAQQGLIWAGLHHIGSRYTKDSMGINYDGSWLGFMATSSPDKNKLIRERDEETARLFGRRVAEVVARWNGE